MPKVEHPRRKKTQHRSIQDKYADYDKMQHSTWAKGEKPRKRATVVAPKTSSFTSRLRKSVMKAAGATGRAGVSVVRGLLGSKTVNPADPHAAQKREYGYDAMSVTDTFRRAGLIAAAATRIPKKKKK